jgi:HK97 gp10 family phage protein
MMTFRTDGTAELLRNIEQFPKKIQRRIINGALRDASKPIIQATRVNAPVETGALRRSIRPTTVRKGKYGPVMLVHVGKKRTIKNRRTKMTREEDAYYAKFVEFGAKAHPIVATRKLLKLKSGRFARSVKHPGTPKQEFFTRAINTQASTATQVFVKQVRARLTAIGSARSL